ncbi:MAG: CBS domain-containing protein [Caldilineaceae bacterium]|nr:CBS domain-containing protein [Caldilineaceae bacterium]
MTESSGARPMHELILTHEHTDFDALASLVGAALLFPGAIPLLPYQLNRNVAEFVTLYRNQFPFLHPRELPRRPVSRAILVDTRTVNLPKGMQDSTGFLVIDHHSVDQELPAGWQHWSEPVGANTTLLVEKLIEQQIDLTSVQATLLALGIHEDTGSLTYAATTHRDARCLAWLMEPAQGVNLEVLSRFLQHPLNAEQRVLLQSLIEQSEFLENKGYTIIIACADAPQYTSELSTLAHRLREFHEADALFLIVDLGEMIQIVARSTTDAIDVGALMRALGGGGHVRAAAASVHEQTLPAIRAQLIQLLHHHSQAATTVRQIMSVGRPQMLAPAQTIDDAAVLMRRYGHEGFPVVGKETDGRDRLLGVLTRREADRAINHGLGGSPVQRFMQVGQVTVQPTDSIHQLRKTMIDSGWGQIPVVNEEGAIIGIVTRTDLIKLWDEATLPDRRKVELTERLRTVLSPTQVALLQLVGEEVDQMGYAVYVVGGFVRDLLLNGANQGATVVDLDIVIEGDAIAFAERMQARYGGRVVPHKRFGTAKWLLQDAQHPIQAEKLLAHLHNGFTRQALPPNLDFVTARTEFYTAPTVLPTVEQGSIKLDLHRRDFTINTLALCLNPERWGELLDFYGGVHDLQEGVVRVLHSLSFVDDPTRILRAVRYEQRFDFQMDERTLELLRDAIELLDRMTPARIRHEFDRILQESQPEKSLQRLAELGVLQQIHPSLSFEPWHQQHFAQIRTAYAQLDPSNPLASEPLERLYWGVLTLWLPASVQTALTERLGLRGETQQLMAGLSTLHTDQQALQSPDRTPSQVVHSLEQSTPAAIALWQTLAIEPQLTPRLTRYLAEWRHVRPLLDGHALRALGFPSGPLYSKILAELRAARLDGRVQSREDEEALARQITQIVETQDFASLVETQDFASLHMPHP